MHLKLVGFLVLVLAGRGAVADTARPVRAERLDAERVAISVDGELFTEYRHSPEHKFPFLYPVNGPRSGRSVTTWDTDPFPHHSSLWFACDHVNGANYWQALRQLATGQIEVQRVDIESDGPEQVVLVSEHLWRVPGQDPVLHDLRRITVTAPAAGLRLIDFEITLEPLVLVRINRNNHSLFAARMAPDLSVDGGGRLVNAEGLNGADETYGKTSDWMAGYGRRDAGVEGLAVFPHPANRWHPAPWFTRNYGFFSPTPMQWLPAGHVELPAGEAFTLRYRVVVFAGDPQEAGLARLYEEYMAEAEPATR